MSVASNSRTWQNWGRTVRVTPAQVVEATDTAHVQAIVRRAAEQGMTVKAVGAGHSFSDIAAAPGVQVNLDRLAGVVSSDDGTRRVALRAGTRLHQVPGLLGPRRLAMENLGDIDAQSLAGAISTGTHGTGFGLGGIATQVTELELVDGLGEVRRLAGDQVRAAAIGLGALGIVTELTLQCVDQFVLDALERPEPLAAVLAEFPDRVRDQDHFEFYWFPHTTTALTKQQTRHRGDVPRRPLSRFKRWVDDDLVANALFRATCTLGHLRPTVIPSINRVATRLTGDRHHVDYSTQVFTTKRDVAFREMEYAIELSALPQVMREIGDQIERHGWQISFPIECRAAAADDLWLSTAYGRASGYVAIHSYWRDDHRAYFDTVEDIFAAHGGRPHWGKMHTRTQAELAGLYPRFDDFVALRDELDPQRVFGNPYLERVLG